MIQLCVVAVYSNRKFRFFLRILKVLCAFLFAIIENILFLSVRCCLFRYKRVSLPM